MEVEREFQHKRPYEVFGLTKKEQLFWRVSQERFQEILDDDQTIIHAIKPSSNNYGEFLFVTASRPGIKDRIAMTFYGLGYHEHRERWLTQEWFWYQANPHPNLIEQVVDKDEAKVQIHEHLERIRPYINRKSQTRYGQVFELLAAPLASCQRHCVQAARSRLTNLTDEDGALAEMEDLASLDDWLFEVEQKIPREEPPPTLKNLLDQNSNKKLP